MSLRIRGDKIIFNDFEAATISEDLPPSQRDALEAALELKVTVWCPSCETPIALEELD